MVTPGGVPVKFATFEVPKMYPIINTVLLVLLVCNGHPYIVPTICRYIITDLTSEQEGASGED